MYRPVMRRHPSLAAGLVLVVALFGAVLSAVGCGQKIPPPQYSWDKSASFAAVKTYAWYDGPPFRFPGGNSMVDGKFIDQHVRKAVDAGLARKGYQKTDAATPDFWVSYHTSPDEIQAHDTWGNYTWYSPPIFVGTSYEKYGALALDVREPGKKLIWRGVLTRSVGKNPDDLADAIDKGVDELLAKFPPLPGS